MLQQNNWFTTMLHQDPNRDNNLKTNHTTVDQFPPNWFNDAGTKLKPTWVDYFKHKAAETVVMCVFIFLLVSCFGVIGLIWNTLYRWIF